MTILSTLHAGSYAPGTAVNPLTILGSGTITAASGYALSLVSGTSWYVLNQGLITASSGNAVDMVAGTIVNQGVIGGTHGVVVTGGGTVTNAGTIMAGTSSPGVYLDAVSFASGVANTMVVDQGARFIGTVNGGNTIGATAVSTLEFASGAGSGTFSGLGSAYVDFAQVSIAKYATWSAVGQDSIAAGQTLINSGYFTSAATFTNAGLIAAPAGAFTAGVTLDGGALSNSGTIYGYYAAIRAYSGGGTVVNTGQIMATGTAEVAVSSTDALIENQQGGTIAATLGTGVVVGGPGTLINDGLLTGDYYAVRAISGSVTNEAQGTMSATMVGAALGFRETLVNDGLITGASIGINGNGSYLRNDAGGAIVGGTIGVYGSGSFVNGGTIAVTNSGFAIQFSSAASNFLGVDPGAVFIGTVDGGNTIGAAAVSTLEFAASTSFGTFAGLGSQYVNFAQVSIDVGARWAASGVNLIAAGQTLTDGGALSDYGSFTNDGYVKVTGSNDLHVYYGTFANNGRINVTGNTVGAFYVRGGLITNAVTASILGGAKYGVYALTATVVNAGTISGASQGVLANFSSDSVTNLAGGIITGGTFGVYALAAGDTVINAGTIGGTTDAVRLAGGAANRLIVDPGAKFIGAIDGGNTIGATAVSTLEFGAGIGTLSGFGAQVTNFAQVTLDAGAQWNLAGSAAGFDSGETISGFAAGSTLELVGTSAAYGSLGGGVLTLAGGITIDLPGAAHVNVATAGGNTYIMACFASGTRIMGAFGAVPVEALREGDLVRTARGRLAPVGWIGHRRTNLAKHPRPLDVMPVRVRAGAFGEGVPARDLVLSPDHAVFVDGKLVPVRYLINGVSIVQETRAAITYWHVELDRHDIILAEGMACESYLDTGNRNAFENAPDAVQMTPAFARAVWVREGCAPIVTDTADPWLRRLHTRLLAAAERAARAA